MGAIVRILLRYLAAFLVAKGFLTPDDAQTLPRDPDLLAAVEMFLGFAIIAATEAWYWLAKRFGWST